MTTETMTERDDRDDLMSPPEERDLPRNSFGQITIVNDFDCVLLKGVGKVPYSAGMHAPDQKRVAIEITMICTKKDGTTYERKLQDINTGSKWRASLPSLQRLGVTSRAQVRDLLGKWVQVEDMPTGRTYEAKKGERVGQMVDETTWKFIAIYDSEEACRAAEQTFYTPRNGNGGTPHPNDPKPISVGNEATRKTLLDSLPLLWNAAGKNVALFKTLMAANTQYAENGIVFESDEVDRITGHIPF